MDISQRIQKIMDSKGISRYRLAKELGVHQTTLKNWFDKCSFTIETLKKIAAFLDIPIADLLPDTINLVEDGVINKNAALYIQLIKEWNADLELKTLTENYKRLSTVGKDKLIDYLDLLLRREDNIKPDAPTPPPPQIITFKNKH